MLLIMAGTRVRHLLLLLLMLMQIFWDNTLATMLLPTVKLAAVCLQAYSGPLVPAAAAAAGDSSSSSCQQVTDTAAAEATDGQVPTISTSSSPADDAAAAAAAAFDDWLQLWREDSVVGLEPICIADHLR
jgi:hypothetical protein